MCRFSSKRYSDFPAPTLICVLADSVSGSPLELTCCASDPCLCSTLISPCSSNKSLFHSHFPVHLGPSPNIPFTVRNRTNSPHWDPALWIFLVTSTTMILYFLSGHRTLNSPTVTPFLHLLLREGITPPKPRQEQAAAELQGSEDTLNIGVCAGERTEGPGLGIAIDWVAGRSGCRRQQDQGATVLSSMYSQATVS